MHRRRFLRHALSAAPLLASPRISLTQPGATFEAGAALRTITPNPLLPITGGMGTPVAATEKRGELSARAFALRSSQGGEAETIVIVGLDLLGFPSVLGNRVRALVPRLAPERILIGATHTHSAPDTYAFPDGKGGHTGSLEYMQFVVEQAAAAVNETLDRLRPAELRIASGAVRGQIAYNYYAPDLYDRQASLMQARGQDGETIATLVNYAVHPEVLGSGRGILSPDLVGPLCTRIESSEGGVALFMNGAQGGMITADNRDLSQPPKDPLRGYWNDKNTWEECERIGWLLASESLRILGGAPWQRQPALRNHFADVRFPVDSEDLWQVVKHSPLQYPHRDEDRSIEVRVNLIQLGKAQILTIPGEALPNIGLFLKRKMGGEHKFLFGLTNDAFGYILTQVDYGSFDTYRYISRVCLGEMTGEIYIRRAFEMIERAGSNRA